LKCINCGKEIVFFEGKRGPKPKYCSNYCRGRYRYLYPEKVGRAPAETKICPVCGASFKSYSKKQIYCSVGCRGLSKRTLKGTTRECIICGDAFEPTHKEAKCCSHRCQAVASNRKLVEKLAKTTQICQECDNEYTPLRANQVYCSKNCRDKAYVRKNPDYASAKRHRYRSRLAGAEHEEVVASEIYERDGWRCGICGKRVNKRLKYPDPLSPTLDHIIPLSLGGAHTKDNLQLAHYICNITKGNRSIMPNDKGQLMLV